MLLLSVSSSQGGVSQLLVPRGIVVGGGFVDVSVCLRSSLWTAFSGRSERVASLMCRWSPDGCRLVEVKSMPRLVRIFVIISIASTDM